MSTTTCKSKDAAAATMSGRFFFLDFAGVRVFSANADGSDLKTIVREGRKLPDGLAVDSAVAPSNSNRTLRRRGGCASPKHLNQGLYANHNNMPQYTPVQ
jgi:hypothetical protein